MLKDVSFYRGNAQIYNKAKNKTDNAAFSLSIKKPDRLRLSAYLGLIGYPLGVLTVNGERAQLVDHLKHTIYRAEDGSRALRKLLKIDLQPQEIIAALSGDLMQNKDWQCIGQMCRKGTVLVKNENVSGSTRVVVDSDRAKVIFLYKPTDSGSTNFNLKTPKNYKIRNL